MTTLIPRWKRVKKDQKAFLKRSRLNRRTDKHYWLPVSQDRRVQVSQIPSINTPTSIFVKKCEIDTKVADWIPLRSLLWYRLSVKHSKNTSRSRVSRQANDKTTKQVSEELLQCCCQRLENIMNEWNQYKYNYISLLEKWRDKKVYKNHIK